MTIQCTERGLLLNRVRGELRSLINSHRRLYESSAAFGVRKALLAQAEKEADEESCAQLEKANARLEKEIEDARADLAGIIREYEEKVATVRAE